jgi:hypothetical protein
MLLSPERAAARAASLVDTTEEFLHAAWDAAMDGASAPIDLSGGGFIDFASFSAKLSSFQLVTLSPFGEDSEEVVNLGILEVPNFKGVDSTALEWVAAQLEQKHLVVVSAAGHGTAERLREVFIQGRLEADLVDAIPENPKSKTVYLMQTPIKKGFVSEDSLITFITNTEYYSRSSYTSPQVRKLAVKRGAAAIIDHAALARRGLTRHGGLAGNIGREVGRHIIRPALISAEVRRSGQISAAGHVSGAVGVVLVDRGAVEGVRDIAGAEHGAEEQHICARGFMIHRHLSSVRAEGTCLPSHAGESNKSCGERQ